MEGFSSHKCQGISFFFTARELESSKHALTTCENGKSGSRDSTRQPRHKFKINYSLIFACPDKIISKKKRESAQSVRIVGRFIHFL